MSIEHDVLRPLAVPRCPSCGTLFWYPRVICGRCSEPTVEESRLFEGVVYSTTDVYRSKPEWRTTLPYSVALISCSAGFRILTQHNGLQIGDPVIVGQRSVEHFGVIPFSEISVSETSEKSLE